MIDLAAWHAEPLPPDEAQAQLADLRTATSWDDRLAALRLRLLLGLPSEMQHEVLLAEAQNEQQRAAVELLFGPMLLAQRRQGAWHWLDAAEKRLAHGMSGEGYIQLMRRHAALRPLVLFRHGKTARPLPALLAIAAATSQLEAKSRSTARASVATDARDTLG